MCVKKTMRMLPFKCVFGGDKDNLWFESIITIGKNDGKKSEVKKERGKETQQEQKKRVKMKFFRSFFFKEKRKKKLGHHAAKLRSMCLCVVVCTHYTL